MGYGVYSYKGDNVTFLRAPRMSFDKTNFGTGRVYYYVPNSQHFGPSLNFY